jgi:hypothetical protein
MRKALTTTLAAVTAVGAVLATAAPAEAQRYRHYDRHHHRGGGDATAAAIIGGVAGLALGAAISGNNDGRRSRSYYNGGYSTGYAYDPRYDSYDGGYYSYREPPRYRTCVTRDRVYDPYIGRRVTIERQYAC